MLLADELLLLLTSDDTGTNVAGSWVDYLLAGALLVDLSLAGNVRVTEKGESEVRKNRVVVVPDAPAPTDPLLVEALELMQRQQKWFRQTAIEKLRWGGLKRKVYERLVRAELVERDERRVLGFIPLTRYPSLDSAPEERLLGRIDEVLLFDAEPDQRVAALIALLHAGNMLIKVVDRGRGVDRRAIKAKAKLLRDQYWAAKAAADAIQAAQGAAAAGG